MHSEITNILNQYSGKRWLNLSLPEIELAQDAIAHFVDAIENSQTLEEGEALLNMRFGALQNNIFHLAAKLGDEVQMSRMLAMISNDKGYIDSVNNDFLTPLHFAARNGHLAIVEMLVNAEAEINPRGSGRKWVPLHYAIQYGHLEIAKFFIKSGVNKEIKTGFSLTPLIVAAEFGHLHIINFLLSNGVEKNAQTSEDNHKMTALHYAILGNHFDVAVTLLYAGIDRDKETTFGLTALELAAKVNNFEMVSLLMAWGNCRKWNDAEEIANKVSGFETIRRIKAYQKVKKNLFSVKWIENEGAEFINMLGKFNHENLAEEKIVLSPDVSFNAYGIASLQHKCGFFRKTTKTFLSFAVENNLEELVMALRKIRALMSR